MSAKKKKRPASASSTPSPSLSQAAAQNLAAPVAVGATGEMAPAPDTPRKKLIANIVLVVVWIYVGMLYLLALDQQFHWGIFGP